MSKYPTSSPQANEQPVGDGDNECWLRRLALSYRDAGDVLLAQGYFAKASEKYQASLSLFDRLAASDPDSPGVQVDLAKARVRVADARVVEARAQVERMNRATKIGWLQRAVEALRSARLATS